MMKRRAVAGTLESNDIYIVLEERPGDLLIELESIVLLQYGRSIRQSLMAVLDSEGIERNVHIKATDKGALPCTIEARMRTVLGRAGLLKGGAS